MIAVQCWDDGVHDDIRLIEILRKHKAKGSFNLNIGRHQQKRAGGWNNQGKEVYILSLGELKDVYEGVLVANHTVSHPSLAEIPVEQATREVREGRERLEQHFGYAVEGFAYPNGSHSPAVHEIVREAGHLYARTCENADHVFPPADPMSQRTQCHFMAEDFWARFEKVKAADGVFYFWGHSYEIMNEKEWADFEDKIERISREAEWKDLPELFKDGGPGTKRA